MIRRSRIASGAGILPTVDATLREMVDAFAAALGPFADPGVGRLASDLPDTLSPPADLRVLMQGHRRSRGRSRALLLTVIGDRLTLAGAGGSAEGWPVSECSVTIGQVRLAGMPITVRVGDRQLALVRTMPVDEASRLADLLSRSGSDASWFGAGPFSAQPPVARLGAAATLYLDRIAFADAPTRMLTEDVRARALAMPSPGRALRSVSRLMQGSRGQPRHVLIDGPGWSQVAAAPETAPQLADVFAEAVNRHAAHA